MTLAVSGCGDDGSEVYVCIIYSVQIKNTKKGSSIQGESPS